MKNPIAILFVCLLITACTKKDNPFLIEKQNIGHLTDSTQVKDLETVFIDDSISRYISGDEFTGSINDIDIFEKGGKLLLALTPAEALDSSSTIRTVRVVDERFKTKTGLSVLSTFKDISDNYKISSIQNTLTNVVISVDEINAYFTIDKEELPSNMRFDMNLKIEAIQIPDQAKIKNFYLYWK